MGILFTIVTLLACGGDDNSETNASPDRSTAIALQLNVARSPAKSSAARSIGNPDVCIDYRIDTIAVQVHRTKDNTEVASVERNCSEHSLTITDIPAGESLYVVWKGGTGEDIYYYNRSNVTNITFNLNGSHYNPQINDDGHVAWWTMTSVAPSWDIYYWDGATEINVSNNSNENSIVYPGDWNHYHLNNNGHLVWMHRTPDSNYEIIHNYY